MQRWLFFFYGVACHLLFFGLYGYMAGFVGNIAFSETLALPKTIDSPSSTPLAAAMVINVLLLGLFAVQHSVMARPAFKKAWTRITPPPIERSNYVLASIVVTVVVMWQWRGVDVVIWDVQQPALRALLWGAFAFGWLMVPAVSLMIDHFDLFGVRQVWLHFRGKDYTPLPFRTPWLYAYMRHPLYVGWAIAFWATPKMTLGHLLFAGGMTVYMAGAAVIEERDLIAYFGESYKAYRRRVPMFVPRLFGRSAAPGEAEEN